MGFGLDICVYIQDLIMSAHVLLNLLNGLRKRDKMRGFLSILSLFRNKFNKINNTGAQIMDSTYHLTLKLLKNRILDEKTSIFFHLLRNVIMDVITLRYQSINHYLFIDFIACRFITTRGDVM